MLEGIFALVGVVIGYTLCLLKKESPKQIQNKLEKTFYKKRKAGHITSPSKLLKEKEFDDL